VKGCTSFAFHLVLERKAHFVCLPLEGKGDRAAVDEVPLHSPSSASFLGTSRLEKISKGGVEAKTPVRRILKKGCIFIINMIELKCGSVRETF